MKPLPNLMRKLPFLLYAAAVLIFVWHLANSWIGMTLGAGPYVDPSMDGYLNLQKSNALYQAFLEAIYLVWSGAALHVLIAIYDCVAPTGGDVE